LYEAARIDGASGLKLYTQITIPLLLPVIRINVIMAVISALKQMETIYLTTNGGPGNTSQFLANYLYIKAFNSFEYGYGNAISVLFVVACLVATYLLNKLLRREAIEY
jgi:raffinose/stachyose/melibiose transport system permease protein